MAEISGSEDLFVTCMLCRTYPSMYRTYLFSSVMSLKIKIFGTWILKRRFFFYSHQPPFESDGYCLS
jgi:hypothetical protein